MLVSAHNTSNPKCTLPCEWIEQFVIKKQHIMFSNKFTIITAIHQMITDTSYTHKEGFSFCTGFLCSFRSCRHSTRKSTCRNTINTVITCSLQPCNRRFQKDVSISTRQWNGLVSCFSLLEPVLLHRHKMLHIPVLLASVKYSAHTSEMRYLH